MKISHLISLNKSIPGTINTFSFTLPQSATTSAGVYDADDTLIRTLWSAEPYIAGTHVYQWDGLLDDRSIALQGNYSVKVLSHNVTYAWDGARIGNTSTNVLGGDIHKGFQEPFCVAIADNKLFYGAGYQERSNTQNVVYLDVDIGKRYKVAPGNGPGTNHVSTVVCTDGNYVYWGGYYIHEPPKSDFVFATRVDNNAQVTFPQGTYVQGGNIGYSAISLLQNDVPFYDNTYVPTALAVQKNGNFLFVARKGIHQLQVVHKTTGAFVKNITINNIGQLTVDNDDSLWISIDGLIEKYTVDSTDGSITSTGITLIGTTFCSAIAVSPDNTTIVVIDGDIHNQVLRGYGNTAGGSPLWTFGTLGGYSTDSRVTNTKFYFSDVREIYPASIAFESDGSFWVTEMANTRIQHYSANRVFINNIMYLGCMYQVATVINNGSRLVGTSGTVAGGSYLEFAIDTSISMDNGQNGSWILTHNWGAKAPAGLDNLSKFINTIELSGRTFTILRGGNDYRLYELVSNGVMRATGINVNEKKILPDGKMINISGFSVGTTSTYNIHGYVGLDSNNNPTWTSSPIKTVITPTTISEDPISERIQVSDDTIYFFQGNSINVNYINYHFGALDINTNKWKFKTSPGTSTQYYYTGDFPAKGQFDNGNNVSQAGGFILLDGSNLIWTYRGEFWKVNQNYGQTNKFNHFHINGLFINQFGVLRKLDRENQPGVAGNAFTGSWVQDTSDRAFIYHGDEGNQGGYHRWRVTGLDTVQIASLTFSNNLTYTPPQPTLMDGLTKGGTLSGVSGWTVSHPNEDGWFAGIGYKTADKFGVQDIWLRARLEGYDDKIRYVSHTLGNNNTANWTLSGIVNFADNEPSAQDRGDAGFVQVLDDTGKIIVQLYETEPSQDNGISDVQVNGQILHRYPANSGERIGVGDVNQPFSFINNNGTFTVTYYNYTITTTIVAETGANASKPTTFRLLCKPSQYFPRNRQKSVSTTKIIFKNI